jgi:Cu(I)/Ag(I) efflux system protein CusF
MGGMKMNDHAMGMETMQPTHKATGTVKAIDAAKGTITIAHGAVKSANWPAMKMNFKITPEMIGGINAGDQVEFEFVAKGMEAMVTRIAVLK